MPTSSYTFKVLLDGREAIASAKRIRAELQRELSQGIDLRQQMTAVDTQAQRTAQQIELMGRELRGATQESGRLEVDLRHADDATRSLITSFYRGEMSARQLEQALQGGGQAVEETRQKVKWLGRDLQEVAQMGRLDRLGAAMTAAARETYGLRTLAGGVGRMGMGMMATGAAITGPAVLASKRYVEYTRDVARSTRAMGLAREESEALRQELIRQSETLGMVSPEEMAEGLYQWVTGVGATAQSYEELQQIIKDTIPIQEMAYLQGIDLATATEFTAGIMGEFGLAVSETERVVDVLDATADRTFAQVTDLGEAFKMVGPIAHQLGISVEETAAAFGILSDANIKGTRAGRAMRQMLIGLTKTSKKEDEILNKILHRNEALGESWKDLAFRGGQFVGIAEWVDLLAAATENLTQEERAAALATIATANELPALTHLVESQIEARQHGVNVIRAEAKILDGVIDSEAEAYARFVEETTGNIMSLDSAHETHARKVEGLTEEEGYQIDQLTRKWDAAMLHLGAAVMEMALPAVEELTRLLGEIAEFVEKHPETVQAAVATGGILAGLGILTKVASSGIRLYADVSLLKTAVQMVKASDAMLEAAGLQAIANKSLLTGFAGITTGITTVGAMIAGLMYAGEKMGLPKGTQTLFAVEGETYEDYLATIQRTAQHPVKMLTEAQWEAVRAGEDLRDVTSEVTTEIEGWEYELLDATDEMKDLKEAEREARREAQGLGSDLAQVSTAAATGLSAFSEEQLKAIDMIWEHTRRRNEMVQENNEELLEMGRDFQEKEAEQYQDYLRDRDKLQKELAEVTQDPLWEMTEEVQAAREKEAEAFEDYNKRMAEAIEQYQRKLRNLRESHEDKMEDLEAKRDAKGILRERRQYARSLRDANESHQDTLDSLSDRLQESIEQEREAIAKKRKDRREDLEKKLKELDEGYAEEARKRKEDFDKRYAEKQVQNQKELQQLEQSHTEKLAKIMLWEQRVRDALRNSYIGREEDLRVHLARMERAYLETYSMLSELSPEAMTPAEYRQWHEEVRGHQAGGYAPRGLYRLGEAGREFVLNAPTTTALERAIGPLNQARVLNMAHASSYNRLDIRVIADDHFSPAFQAQTEAAVRAEIVRLSKQTVEANQPGAYS